MLSNIQKFSLLLGAVLMWGDQISDIVMGISYWLNCHYLWAILSAVFTALPTVLGFLILTLSGILFDGCCATYDFQRASATDHAVKLSAVLCQPFFATYLVYNALTDGDEDDKWGRDGPVFMIKVLKTLEILS